MHLTPSERDRLAATIDSAWDERATITARTTGRVREAVDKALGLLDRGVVRVAEPADGGWTVNEWLKKAVLLSFRLNPMTAISGGPGEARWWLGAAWYQKLPAVLGLAVLGAAAYGVALTLFGFRLRDFSRRAA